MDITISSNQFKLHIVNKTNYKMYSNRLNNTYICNAQFISNSYENLYGSGRTGSAAKIITHNDIIVIN